MTVIPIVIGALGKVTKGLLKGLKKLEIKGRGDNPNYYTIEIGQDTE